MSIRNNIPNSITCVNLVCGAMACVAAFHLNETWWWGLKGYQAAYVLIGIAAIADFLDGLVARAIGAVSAIGKELDSLCDLVSFGLAPAMLMYNLLEPEVGAIALAALLIAVGGALRLARFNVDTNQTTTFTGLPIPANAIFWVGYTAFAINTPLPTWAHQLAIVALSWLMVSPLRMFSLKMHDFSIGAAWQQYTLIVGTVFAIVVCGLPGLAIGIALYVVLALIKQR